MPITINITGDNASHAVGELCNFVAGMHTELQKLTAGIRLNPAVSLQSDPAPQVSLGAPATPTAPVSAPAPVAEAAAPSEAPKKGSKKKAAELPPAPPPPQEVVIPVDESATLDNARLWIQAVNAKLGLDSAAKIITSFGVKKVSDMAAEKYTDFITKCKTTLGEKPDAANTEVESMM